MLRKLFAASSIVMLFAFTAATSVLDLNVDPLVPGGLSGADIQAYENMGYRLEVLNSDVHCPEIIFQSESTGEMYSAAGVVLAGEAYLIHDHEDDVIFTRGGQKGTLPTKETIEQEKAN